MKIIKLKSENILRLDAVEIEPDGSVVIIGGKNEQGKTSVLDSIVLAMGGRAAKHSRPLRDGAEKGEIEIELDDFIVRRTYTPKGTALKVTSKDGAASYSSPQKMLDGLVGQLTFDPLAWKDMDTRKQVEVLKEMVGLDFTVMNQRRKELYDERTVLNRQLKENQALFDSMPSYQDTPDEYQSAIPIIAEQKRQIEVNQRNAEQREKLEELSKEHDEVISEIDEMKKKIERLENVAENLASAMNEQQDIVKNLVDFDPDNLNDSISQIEDINRDVRAKQRRQEIGTKVQELLSSVSNLTDQIDGYDREKETQLKQAEFPIDGLGFDESEVLYKGVPFSQCSSAEKLRVSVAMGLAMNPKLKVLLIRDGSLLDEDNLRIISEMVTDKDAQIWIERVGKGEECSVIIEDGKILEKETIGE